MAFASCIALALVGVVELSRGESESVVDNATPAEREAPAAVHAGAGSEELDPGPIIKEAVIWHRRHLPLEVIGPSDRRVRRWFDGKVNFPVRLPRFNRKNPGKVNLLGARLSQIRDRQAAYVIYEAEGSKLSVMVFNPNPRKRVIRNIKNVRSKPTPRRPIYFQNAGGYNVAVVEDNGVTYSITSELTESEMVELVDAAFEQP